MDKLGKFSTCAEVLETYASVPESSYNHYKNGTIIVTGANTGIGKVTAQYLAYYGAHVVLACRTEKKAEEAIEWILKSPVRKKYKEDKPLEERVKFVTLDLSDLSTIPTFVSNFEALDLPPLCCLVLNAGVLHSRQAHTKDGFNVQFGVNHLAHFHLTRMLLPNLKSGSTPEMKSRVVVVSSLSHAGPYMTKQFDNEDELLKQVVHHPDKKLSLKNSTKLYGNSKLCNVLFAQSLNEKEAENGVNAVSLHPGSFITTDVARDTGMVVNFLFKYVIGNFTKNPDQGSSTTLTCVLAPESRVTGTYFDNCQEARVTKYAKGDLGAKARETLWMLSEKLLSKY